MGCEGDNLVRDKVWQALMEERRKEVRECLGALRILQRPTRFASRNTVLTSQTNAFSFARHRRFLVAAGEGGRGGP